MARPDQVTSGTTARQQRRKALLHIATFSQLDTIISKLPTKYSILHQLHCKALIRSYIRSCLNNSQRRYINSNETVFALARNPVSAQHQDILLKLPHVASHEPISRSTSKVRRYALHHICRKLPANWLRGSSACTDIARCSQPSQLDWDKSKRIPTIARRLLQLIPIEWPCQLQARPSPEYYVWGRYGANKARGDIPFIEILSTDKTGIQSISISAWSKMAGRDLRPMGLDRCDRVSSYCRQCTIP